MPSPGDLGVLTPSSLGAAGVAQKLAASAIPFIVAPTGTMANNGAITLGTGLPTTYANAYIFLPAGAIAAGVPAAPSWFFCQMTSATVGTVFNNTYVSGVPAIPAAPVAFATVGPGAYVGVTGLVAAQQISIPAGSIGPNGALRFSQLNSVPNNANTKIISASFAGVTMWDTALTATNGSANISTLMARGAQNSSVILSTASPNGVGNAGAANQFLSTNFAVAQTLSINLTTAVATDFIVLESFLIEVIPG